MRTDPGAFEELTAQALDELPEWVRERLENVEILIEQRPPRGEPDLLGRYHGIPLTERGAHYAGVLPDTITLYQRTIERLASGDDELRDTIAHTIVHEVAHFFGISDARLRDMDRY